MIKRSEINDKYKWDLSSYIKDEQMLKEEMDYLRNTYPKFKDFYGKFNVKATLHNYLHLRDEYDVREDRLAHFIYHSLDVDNTDTKFLSLKSEFEFLMSEKSQATAFITPQIIALEEDYLKDLYQDKEFADYKRTIEEILRYKKHTISEHDSELISKMGLFLGSSADSYGILTNGEISFEKIEVDGKSYEVDESLYSTLMRNPNREVRKKALSSLMNGYGEKVKTLSSMYLSDIQEDIFFSKLYDFNSVREQRMYGEEVDSVVYDRLIAQINQNLPLLHQSLEVKRKALGLDKLAYYDVMMDFESNKKYTIEEAIELVKKATLPLGEEYQLIVNRKFNEKSIDYLPSDNKERGAYSSGSYGCPSIIFMNFVDNLDSVSTLAHEMGHTMHTELSNMTQPYSTSSYEIFVAEVASTVNELLLQNYLEQTANSEVKKTLAFELFDSFRSTVFRQTMFSEFEDWAHKSLENKIPLTYDDLNKYYYELKLKYYGKAVEMPDEMKFEWSRIPHFYRPFYVYKYATGFISAVCIVKKLLTEKDYYKKYINFLKSGSSKPVVDLLKEIDVDLTCDEPYEIAFGYLKEQLDEVSKNF